MASKESPGAIQLTMKQGVDIAEVHAAVEKLISVLRPGGCTRCGLGGIDLIIHGGDPEIFEQLQTVAASEGVLAVTQAAQGGMAG